MRIRKVILLTWNNKGVADKYVLILHDLERVRNPIILE